MGHSAPDHAGIIVSALVRSASDFPGYRVATRAAAAARLSLRYSCTPAPTGGAQYAVLSREPSGMTIAVRLAGGGWPAR